MKNGLFSNLEEIHAFLMGLFELPWNDKFELGQEVKDMVAKEPWYYRGGRFIGVIFWVTFVTLLLTVAVKIIQV